MDIQRVVDQFVSESKDLYHRLRSKGENLSDLDLVALREQLYLLDEEAGHLQDLKSDGVNFVFKSNRPPAAKALNRKATH